MRFAIPAHAEARPPWLLRSALWLYDRLGSRSGLPRSETIDITKEVISLYDKNSGAASAAKPAAAAPKS